MRPSTVAPRFGPMDEARARHGADDRVFLRHVEEGPCRGAGNRTLEAPTTRPGLGVQGPGSSIHE